MFALCDGSHLHRMQIGSEVDQAVFAPYREQAVLFIFGEKYAANIRPISPH
jgi:hypothetical protein